MMKKTLLLLLILYCTFGYCQSYQFDAFVEIYHEVPSINYKGSQVLLLNTSDDTITAFSDANSSFTVYDTKRNIGHIFQNKTTQKKYSFIYKSSFKIEKSSNKYRYELQKIAENTYEINEYSLKKKENTFKTVIELERSEKNLLKGFSADIGESRRLAILKTLEKEVGNEQKFKIKNALTYYRKDNIINYKTIKSDNINIEMSCPKKLIFRR